MWGGDRQLFHLFDESGAMCGVRRANVEVGISHTQICISGACKKSSKYKKGCCIQPI